ncbi:MAG: pilus assembly protein TadG-related protein [Planctomycetota bacterium]|jgi:hypothetical protein
MGRFLKRLAREENGQGLLFGVVSLFILCLCTAMVYNLGEVTTTRTRVQTAADSAALAGALVEADIASSIAWMNDGMAHVYYHLMRYAVDVIVYGTLREFKLHHDEGGYGNHSVLGLPEITDEHLGIPDIESKYDLAYARAEKWIPKGEEWLEKISSIEEGLLIAGPLLMKQEIFRVARACGAEYVTIWPDIDLWGGGDSELTIIIEKLSNGWRLTASNGYSCEVTQIGPERWKIKVNTGLEVTLGKIKDSPATYEIETNNGTSLRATELPGIGWAVTGTAEGKSIDYRPVPTYGDGAYRISSGGGSVVVRPGPNGTEQYKGGQWVPLQSQDSVNVGGTEIPINHTGAISAGGADIYLPNRIVLGQTEIVLKSNDVDLYAHIGMAEVRIENDEVVVNRLSNLYHDDGKWRTWVHPGVRYGTGGTWRHRMTEESSTTWTYEYQKQGPHFTLDSYDRFAVLHAVFDNQAYDADDPESMKRPLWMKWFQPQEGKSLAEDSRSGGESAYHQSRTCWHPMDERCPMHGNTCGRLHEGKLVRPAGYWHVPDGQGGTRVEPCPCCGVSHGMYGYYHQLGQDHDGDGKTDVRFYQYDSRPHQGNPANQSNPGRNRNDPPYQSIALKQVARPKVLREEFFKFQINVGCYVTPQSGDSLQLIFEDPPWGYFAVASARSGFHDVMTGEYRFVFDTFEERDEWIACSANLYEPDWQAKMFSSVKNIKEEDLDVLPGVETPVNWIYKGMAWYANWRDEFNAVPNKSVNSSLRRILRPRAVDDFFDPMHLVGTREDPFRGGNYDLSDIRFKENVKH